MGLKRTKEPPRSKASSCVHGRLIEDVVVKHQNGKVRCLECGTIFDDPHAHRKSGADNAPAQLDLKHAAPGAADRLQAVLSDGLGNYRPD